MNSHQQFQQNTQVGSGLTRYRSAPSSYFDSLLSTPGGDGGFGADDFEQLFNPRASSPETQVIFSRFMNSSAADRPPITPPPPPPPLQPQQLPPPRKLEPEEYHQPPQMQSNDYSPQIMYSEAAAAATDSKVFAPFITNSGVQNKIERGGGGLIRHTSSPAGFFANINIENEFKTMRSEGSYGGGNNATAEATFSSSNTFLSQMVYSTRGMITTISENETVDAQFDEDHGNDVDFITGLPWDDSALLSDPYLKGLQHNQKNEAGNRPASLLSHHLSLPKSSAAMERLLEDSVPCKIRAKRGCATHPRSIAERVRRTKISDRMRKLQELVPNMEKQTNTSDMLDLAVDYIKDLQTQLKTLSDNQAKCTCSSKQ